MVRTFLHTFSPSEHDVGGGRFANLASVSLLKPSQFARQKFVKDLLGREAGTSSSRHNEIGRWSLFRVQWTYHSKLSAIDDEAAEMSGEEFEEGRVWASGSLRIKKLLLSSSSEMASPRASLFPVDHASQWPLMSPTMRVSLSRSGSSEAWKFGRHDVCGGM